MYKTTVNIEGLMCPMCEKHMNEAFDAAFKAESVESSHKTNKSVIITNEPIDEADIKTAVEKAGYTFVSAVTEKYAKKGFFSKLFKK
jgi:copper chaperone CopZ